MRDLETGLLAKIDAARVDGWIASMRGSPINTPLDELLDPGLATVRKFTDDELAETIAREPNSKLGLLSASVLRSRESWRTPAKWALIVSLASFGLSFWAICRTL